MPGKVCSACQCADRHLLSNSKLRCNGHRQRMAPELQCLPWRPGGSKPHLPLVVHTAHSQKRAEPSSHPPLSPHWQHHQQRGGPTWQAVSAAMSVALLVPAGHSFSEGSSHSPWAPVLAPQCSTSGVEQSETTCTSPPPSQIGAMTKPCIAANSAAPGTCAPPA